MASLLSWFKAVLIFKYRALNLSEACGQDSTLSFNYLGDNETPLILCFTFFLIEQRVKFSLVGTNTTPLISLGFDLLLPELYPAQEGHQRLCCWKCSL